MDLIGLFFQVTRFIKKILLQKIGAFLCKAVFARSNVQCGKGLNSNGIPIIRINHKSKVIIGNGFKLNNGFSFNPIGRNQPCIISVGKDAELSIGNRVGMSSASIVCHSKIDISDDVNIGGGVVIYDTDFHSLDVNERINKALDKGKAKLAPIIIEKGVFLGAHSIILKGVTIGENSIIGAGSVVTKPVPSNEIWAGNPAKFIRLVGD